MRRLAAPLLLLAALAAATLARGPVHDCWVIPHFAPRLAEDVKWGRSTCEEAIVASIDAAGRTVVVQAYSFTAPAIADALIRARRRKVAVAVVVDAGRAREKGGQAARLARAGVEVRADGRHAIAHNKVIVVDDAVVLTGSYNFTTAAAHANAENLVEIHDEAAARRYADNFADHRSHSDPFEPEQP